MIYDFLTVKQRDFIYKKAKQVLGLSHNKNPFILADKLHISVRLCPFNEDLPGFIADGTIYINNNLDSYSQKIVCAHELGHYILHENYEFELFDATTNSFAEFEANIFVLLIMPQAFTLANMNNFKNVSDFNMYVERKIKYK